MSVEVGEHLLAAPQATVQEEDDRDGLVGQVRVLPDRGLNGGPAVLPVVDDEAGVHRDVEAPHFVGLACVAVGHEADVPVNGCGQGGERVGIPVVDHVPGDFRDSDLVEDPLGAQFRHQLLLVEKEDAGDQPQGAHRDVVFPACLDTADRREDVPESGRWRRWCSPGAGCRR